MTSIHPATPQIIGIVFFVHCRSSSGKGRKKRPTTSRVLRVCQEAMFRRMKYSVSSGMFAYQMSMYWLKPM